jgi:hypothetical protein
LKSGNSSFFIEQHSNSAAKMPENFWAFDFYNKKDHLNNGRTYFYAFKISQTSEDLVRTKIELLENTLSHETNKLGLLDKLSAGWK